MVTVLNAQMNDNKKELQTKGQKYSFFRKNAN